MCNKKLGKSGYKIQCSGKCQRWVHQACTSLTKTLLETYRKNLKSDITWVCPTCTEEAKLSSSSESEEDTDDHPTATRKKAMKRLRIKDDDTKQNKTLSNNEMLDILMKKLDALEDSVTFNSNTMDDLQKTIQSILKENKQLKKEQDQLKHQIKQLQDNLEKLKTTQPLDSYREKNILIMGIRAEDSEIGELRKVFKGIEVEVDENDFKIRRLPSKNPSKPILVSFSTKEKRTEVLQKRKGKGALNSVTLGLNGSQRNIYVNEDLPQETRHIFNKARELKTHGFKFVWCKENQVFCRKNETSKIIKITSRDQVDQIQNSKQPVSN